MAIKDKMCHPGMADYLGTMKKREGFNRTGFCNWCGTHNGKPEKVITCPHCKVNYCEKHFDEHLAINYKPHPLKFTCKKCNDSKTNTVSMNRKILAEINNYLQSDPSIDDVIWLMDIINRGTERILLEYKARKMSIQGQEKKGSD